MKRHILAAVLLTATVITSVPALTIRAAETVSNADTTISDTTDQIAAIKEKVVAADKEKKELEKELKSSEVSGKKAEKIATEIEKLKEKIDAMAGNLKTFAKWPAVLPSDEISAITSSLFTSDSRYGDTTGIRKEAVTTALSLVGKNSYKFGGMHTSYETSASDKSYSDFTDTDDSGFISYVLYKAGAAGFNRNSAMSNLALKDIGKKASAGSLMPGDIMVKVSQTVPVKSYANHSVMYIGKTSYGNFTVAECTVNNGTTGVQLNGYKDFKDFTAKRGSYKNIRNPFLKDAADASDSKASETVTGKLSASNSLIGGKKTKVTFVFNAKDLEVTSGAAISLNRKEDQRPVYTTSDKAKKYVVYDITLKKHKKIGTLKLKKGEIPELNRYRGTFSIKRKWTGKPISKKDAYKFAVYDKNGRKVSNTVYLLALRELDC